MAAVLGDKKSGREIQELMQKAKENRFSKGDVKAQFQLGNIFNEGRGVEKDLKQAAEWFLKAAKQSDAEAQYRIGLMYANGEGVEQNLKDATVWLQKAAKQNHITAQFTLPAIRGDAQSQYVLGWKYMKGDGVPQDYKIASEWLQKAAAQSSKSTIAAENANRALKEIRELTKEMSKESTKTETRGTISSEALEENKESSKNPASIPPVEPKTALQILIKQAKGPLVGNGDPEAQYKLGLSFVNGERGLPKNIKQAVYWCRKAAKQGHKDAQYLLGHEYVSKQFDHKDSGSLVKAKEAIDWLQKAAEQKHAGAQYDLGSLHKIGCKEADCEINPDDKTACEFWQQSAEAGNSDAQCSLGDAYYSGQGVIVDYEIALEWYRKAVEQGHAKAKVEFEKHSEIIKLLKEAKSGDAKGQYNLGQAYGRENKDKQAVAWYQKSASQGYAPAQYRLGNAYFRGQGVIVNYEIALQWYRKAVEQGHAGAQAALGEAYALGLGVMEDKKTALAWYQKAVMQPDADAQYEFGKACENGWLNSTAERNYCENGFLSSTGLRNYSEAFRSYYRASNLGHAGAKKLITEFEERSKCENLGSLQTTFALAQFENLIGTHYKLPYNLPTITKSTEEIQEKLETKKAAESLTPVSVLLPLVPSEVSTPVENEKATKLEEAQKVVSTGVEPLSIPSPVHTQVVESLTTPPIEKQKIEEQVSVSLVTAMTEPTTTSTETKVSQEAVMLTPELLQFITSLKTILTPEAQQQLTLLSKDELRVFQDWTGKIANLEASLVEAQSKLALDADSKREQEYIDANLKLKNYQQRLEAELNRFILCYYLAPAGIFKLDDNKKDLVISAIGGIPMAGQYLKILTTALSAANKKYRLYQINKLSELFSSVDEMSKIIRTFTQRLTLIREETILQQKEVHHKGVDRLKGFYQMVKEALEHQKKDLAKSDKTGVTLPVEDKLAVLDCAYLLQQIMSGKVPIDKSKDIPAQFITVHRRGKPDKQSITTPTFIHSMSSVSVSATAQTMITPVAVAHLHAPTQERAPSSEVDVEELIQKIKELSEKLDRVEKQQSPKPGPKEVGDIDAVAYVTPESATALRVSDSVSYKEFHALKQHVSLVTQVAAGASEKADIVSEAVYVLQDRAKIDRRKTGGKRIQLIQYEAFEESRKRDAAEAEKAKAMAKKSKGIEALM